MFRKLRLDPGFRCQNLACPNTLGEGTFDVVVMDEHQSVNAYRPVVLVVCAPCASVLEKAANHG